MEPSRRSRLRQWGPRPESPVARLRMHAHRCLVLVAACAVLVVAGAGTAQAAQVDPRAFVQAFGDGAMAVIKEPGSSPGRRKRQFRELMSENFNLDTIGRFVLDRTWRAATPAQRREYATLFRTFIPETYAVRFEALRETIFTRSGDDAGRVFKALRVRILEVRRVNERDSLVTTEIGVPGRARFHVGYRVRAGNGALKIVDVIAEGVSLLVTRRSEFAAVVKRHGIEGLLAMLRAQSGNPSVTEAALGAALNKGIGRQKPFSSLAW